MKIIILTLSVLIIAFLAFGGLWLYAQQASHPAALAPTTQAPAETETSTVSQFGLGDPSTTAVTPIASTTTHTVGTPVVTPSMITVNTSTPVTVTVQISDPTLIPGSVNLLLLGAAGTQPTILGAMQNTATGVYSFQTTFNENEPGQVQLEVSAAFQGLLKRVLSNIVALAVWNSFTDASSGVTFALPPLGSAPLIGGLGPSSGALFVISVVAVDPSDNLPHPLLRLFALPNPSHEDLQSWFESNVDDASGTLLASGAFQEQQLANGPAFVSVGPIPASYQGGPVAQAYVLSASENLVYSIVQSEDAQLTDFGYSASSVPGILNSILGSVH